MIDNIEEEKKKIINAINNAMVVENISPESLNFKYVIGEYENSQPNIVGCFKNENKWHYYSTDDRINLSVSGPVSLETICTRMIQSLPLTKEQYSKYHIPETELEEMFTQYNSKKEAIDKSRSI